MASAGCGVRRATASQRQPRPPRRHRRKRPPHLHQRHSSPRLPLPLCRRRRLPRAPTTATAMQRVRPALPPFESANRAIVKVSTEMATAPRATTSRPVASGASARTTRGGEECHSTPLIGVRVGNGNRITPPASYTALRRNRFHTKYVHSSPHRNGPDSSRLWRESGDSTRTRAGQGGPFLYGLGYRRHTRWHYHDWRASHNASQRLHS
jgi:hypothetical protein